MKEVYLFTDGFPFGFGEEFLNEEAEALAQRSKLTLITPPSNKPQTKLTGKNVSIFKLPQNIGDTSRIHKISLSIKACFRTHFWTECFRILREGKKLKARIYDALIYAASAELVREELENLPKIPSDALIYTYWTTPVTLALAAKHGRTHRIITRMHGVDLYNERRSTGRQPFRRYIQKRVESIYFACDYGRMYYEKKFEPPKEVCRLARLGVKKFGEELSYSKNEPFVLYSCSSLHKLKRVELIIDTLASVVEMPIHWIHIGSNNNFPEISAYAADKLKYSKCVTYELLGRMPNNEVHQYLMSHCIDAMIALSASEGGCPVSIQEAMAYSVPVIGTDVGGITEMIDGNGILLSADPSVDEVKAAILDMSTRREEELLQMRERSLAIWREMFDADNTIKNFFKRMGV